MSAARPLPPVLLLAAGKGTRLGDLGRRQLKALVEVQGRALLDWHLDHLARQGVERVVINSHHLADQLAEHLERYDGPLQIAVAHEADLLGTAGAAVHALPLIAADEFFVLYGDVLLFADLAGMTRGHRRSGAMASLAAYWAATTHDKGVIESNPTGRITGFVEKPADGTARGGLVNAGLYLLRRELLDGYADGLELDFGHDVFPSALRRGQLLFAHMLDAAVLDIGTPEALAQARANAPENEARRESRRIR